MPVYELEFTQHAQGKVTVEAPTLLIAYRYLNEDINTGEMTEAHIDPHDWYISWNESRELPEGTQADYEVMPDEE